MTSTCKDKKFESDMVEKRKPVKGHKEGGDLVIGKVILAAAF